MPEPGPRPDARLVLDSPAERAPSQVQRAVTLLRDMIVSNRLAPGSNHLEVELAAMLGMSRTPVREAAIILEGQGLVEVVPRRGVRILPISPRDMDEIYSVLTELESLAAHDLAQRRLPAADLAALRALIDQMEAALARDDRTAWAEADDRFHAQLVALAGNRRLEQVVATFSDQVRRARLLTLFIRPSPDQSNADHRALVEAIAAGEPERARTIHRDHRMRAKDLMLGLLERHGFHTV
jgi:DNA-binding GntR family transcriptional regulator